MLKIGAHILKTNIKKESSDDILGFELSLLTTAHRKFLPQIQCLAQILQGGSTSLEGDSGCNLIKATAKLFQHFQCLPHSQDRQPGG